MSDEPDWECPICGKVTFPFLHSCSGVPGETAEEKRMRAGIDELKALVAEQTHKECNARIAELETQLAERETDLERESGRANDNALKIMRLVTRNSALQTQLAEQTELLAGTNLRWEQTITLYETTKAQLAEANKVVDAMIVIVSDPVSDYYGEIRGPMQNLVAEYRKKATS